MHETKTPSPNTKRSKRRLPIQRSTVGKLCCLSTPALYRIAGTVAEANRLLDIPHFSPYHRISKQHTQAMSERSAAMTPMIGQRRRFAKL